MIFLSLFFFSSVYIITQVIVARLHPSMVLFHLHSCISSIQSSHILHRMDSLSSYLDNVTNSINHKKKRKKIMNVTNQNTYVTLHGVGSNRIRKGHTSLLYFHKRILVFFIPFSYASIYSSDLFISTHILRFKMSNSRPTPLAISFTK